MDVGFWMGLALGLIAGMVGCAVVHAVAADHWRNAGRKLWWSAIPPPLAFSFTRRYPSPTRSGGAR